MTDRTLSFLLSGQSAVVRRHMRKLSNGGLMDTLTLVLCLQAATLQLKDGYAKTVQREDARGSEPPL